MFVVVWELSLSQEPCKGKHDTSGGLVKGARELDKLLVLAASLCLTTVGFGLFWSFGAFFKAWGTQWPSSQGFLSKVFITTFPVFALSSVVFGFISDRFGQRLALGWGAGFAGAGCLILALSDETWMIFIGWGILVSIGVAGGFTPVLMALQRFFQNYKGLAAGTAIAGFGLGTMSLAAVSELLISSFGWRKAALLLGAITVASYAATAWAVGIDPKTQAEKRLEVPRNKAQAPYVGNGGENSDPKEWGAPPREVSLRVLQGSLKNPKDLGLRRWMVTDPELAALKQVRDKLSFIIFALSAKAHHNLSFSTDEAAGCKEMLSQLAKELAETSILLEKRGSRSVQEEIKSRVETPP